MGRQKPRHALNLVRMIEQGKIVVLFHFRRKEFLNFKNSDQLRAFLKDIEPSVLSDLEKRAFPSETRFISGETLQPSLLTVNKAAEK